MFLKWIQLNLCLQLYIYKGYRFFFGGERINSCIFVHVYFGCSLSFWEWYLGQYWSIRWFKTIFRLVLSRAINQCFRFYIKAGRSREKMQRPKRRTTPTSPRHKLHISMQLHTDASNFNSNQCNRCSQSLQTSFISMTHLFFKVWKSFIMVENFT